MSGRLELDPQLSLEHDENIGVFVDEPTRIDLLIPLGNPYDFDPGAGEHTPDSPERRVLDRDRVAPQDSVDPGRVL